MTARRFDDGNDPSLPSEPFELSDEDLLGLGLTAQKIAASPEIGAWGEESSTLDGERFVEALRGVRSFHQAE